MADNNCNDPQDLFCKFKNTIDILNSRYLKACCRPKTQPNTHTCDYVMASSFAPGINDTVVPLFQNICKPDKNTPNWGTPEVIDHCVECLHGDIFNTYSNLCAAEDLAGVADPIRKKVVESIAADIWEKTIMNLNKEQFLAFYQYCLERRVTRAVEVRWQTHQKNYSDIQRIKKEGQGIIYDWVGSYINNPATNNICSIIAGVLRYGKSGDFEFDECQGLGGCVTGFMGTWIGCAIEGFATSTEDEKAAEQTAETRLCSFSAPDILVLRWQDDNRYRNEDPPPYLDMIAEGAIAVPVDSTIDCYGSYRVVLSPNADKDTEIFEIKWNTAKEGIRKLSTLSDKVLAHAQKIMAKSKQDLLNYVDKAEENRGKYIKNLKEALSGTKDRLYKYIDTIVLAGADKYGNTNPFPCDGAGLGGVLNNSGLALGKIEECWAKILKETYVEGENIDLWSTGVAYYRYESDTTDTTICIPQADFDNFIAGLRQVQKDIGNQCPNLVINHKGGFTYTPGDDGTVCLPYDPTNKNIFVYYKYPPSKGWISGLDVTAEESDCISSVQWEIMQAIVNLLNRTRLPCGGSPLHSIVQILDANANQQNEGRGPIGGSAFGCTLEYNWPNDYYIRPVPENGAKGGNESPNRRNIGDSIWEFPDSCGVYPVMPTPEELLRLVLSTYVLVAYIEALLDSGLDTANTFELIKSFINKRTDGINQLTDLIPEHCLQPIAIKGRGKGPDARVIALPAEDILWKEEPSVPAPNTSPLIWWTDAPDGDIDIP